MARNIVFALKNDFTGGLNFRADQFQLAENESPDIINMEIDPRGGMFTRAGIQFKHTTPIGVSQTTWNPKSLFYYDGTGGRLILLSTGYNGAGQEGEVHWSTGSNFTRLNLSAILDLDVTNTDGVSFTQWEDTLYFVAGTSNTNAYKWVYPATYASTLTASGPTWQPYASPTGGYMPRANIARVHANKMFVANTYEDGTAYPNRLRWSHEGLAEDWAQEDYIDINAGGEGIRALAIVDGQLLIFKPNATYLLMGYDNDNFQLVEVSTIHGVEYPQQVAEGDGGAYFFDYPKGLFFYNRNGMQDIFLRIAPIITLDEVNESALDKITCSFVNQRLWLSMPYTPIIGDPSPAFSCVNFVFDQSIGKYGAYTMFQTADGYGLVSGCDFNDSSDNSWHLMIHPAQKFVTYVDVYANVEDDIYADGGIQSQLFPTSYTTSWFYDDRYVQMKTFVGPNYVMKEVEADTTIDVDIYYDFNSSTSVRSQAISLSPVSTGSVYGTGLYGSGIYGTSTVGPTIYKGQRFGRCKAIQLQFSGPTTALGTPGRAWGVNSIAYKFKRRNIKG